jgi:hypothetical protein
MKNQWLMDEFEKIEQLVLVGRFLDLVTTGSEV